MSLVNKLKSGITKKRILILAAALLALCLLIYVLALTSGAYKSVREFAQSSSEVHSRIGNVNASILIPCCMRIETNGLDGRARLLVYHSGDRKSTLIHYNLKELDGHWMVVDFE